MGKVINTTTMTVDALTDVADWYVSEGGHEDAAKAQFNTTAGMLLGRKTYEGLAGYWTQETGEWADLLNPMPKFVFSRTLQGPLEWSATLVEGDAADGVARLKNELDEDLILIGCGELAGNLLANGLVDEVRFWLHPAVGGEGTRPYQGEKLKLRLLDSTQYDSGVTLLRYAPA